MTTGLITEPVMTTTPAAGSGTARKTLVQCWSAFEQWYVKCGRDATKLCPRGELRTNHTDPAALTCPVWTPTGFVDSRSGMTVYETGRGIEGV
jgi:hypothetical protein